VDAVRRAALAVGALAAVLAAGSAAHAAERGSLTKRIDKLVRKAGRKVQVSVAYRDFGTGAVLEREAGLRFHPASTIKVPILLAVYAAVDAGELRLSDPVAVRNRFASLVDGSPYALDPAEDGDPELYGFEGKALPIEELLRRMIVRSSNLATNLLIDKLGASQVTDLMRRIGAHVTQVLRGVEDDKAYEVGLNNATSAADLALCLRQLLPGAADAPFSEASRARMLEILKAQEFNEKIPAGLPPGTPVAHKTGDIVGVHHDAAIVFPPGQGPYILVVMTAGIVDAGKADALIADISREVWAARGR
jgi:beta-lactamase class A